MTETATDLRGQLEQWRAFFDEHGSAGAAKLHYRGDYDVVLQHGQSFTSVPWTTWRGSGYRRGKVKRCYQHALHHAMEHPELTYCEGYASRGLMPTAHAWCVTADGRVVDPTWREHDDFGDPVAEWEYLGVPFDLDFVLRVVSEKGTYGILDDFRLYEEPLPDGAIRQLSEGGEPG